MRATAQATAPCAVRACMIARMAERIPSSCVSAMSHPSMAGCSLNAGASMEALEVEQAARPSRAERLALRIMQIGAIAVVLVVSTFNTFELDRFFIPKELALHLTAVAAALLAFRAISRLSVTRVDLLLTGYLLLSTLSAAMATNRWLAARALTISASGVLIFWTSRALREAGLAPPLLGALTLAVVLAAITSLLQAYGVDIVFFSESRVPGGTLGNRNFVAHVVAFGLPICMLAAFRARSFFRSISVTIVTASLVLTRSPGALLAVP